MFLFKILKLPLPIGLKSLIFQICFGLSLFTVVSFLDWGKISFTAGLLFSYIYIFLFFYSVKLLFQPGRRKQGMILMGLKWLFLFLILIGVSWFLDGKSFLIGLSAVPIFWFCYALENWKKISPAA